MKQEGYEPWEMDGKVTKVYRVYGIVQGVGFRPTVSRHAAASGITGSVSNKGPYVEIQAQGTDAQVETFRRLLEEQPPKRATILSIKEHQVLDAHVYGSFEIIESEKTKGEIFISPDIAICDDCKRELYDPSDKRYLHPFINCTCCGPRMTILEGLPYDRERTSMKKFPMCPDCAREYYDPASRRYDAQPVCCNDCGPEVYIIGRGERGRDAITYARRIIAGGGIAAVKGIGGFHLCCNALDASAVELLRTRKRRPMKPFAVMAKDMETAARECVMTEDQAAILDGHQKPILLLEKRKGGKVCSSCAPDNPKLGIMLPYAPLQLLLFDYDDGIKMPDVLVMTSANTSGAPICRDDADAVRELSHLCDCMLSHDRDIRIRADDTVMDFYKGRPYMVRRSRGYAPLPVPVTAGFQGQVLGIGGELKNEFCIGINDLFYLSPYIGDLEDVRTVNALTETEGLFESLLEAQPSLTGCDLHPGYNSSEAAQDRGLPLCGVQHHYAHVLSCMAENDYFGKVIGVSFDGTGYGADGTVWGGEILLSDTDDFERLGHITPFLQIGGDLSAREGWRIAAAMILKEEKDEEKAFSDIEALRLCSRADAKVLSAMARNHVNSVTSTSCGRLFDAACAILGIRLKSTFEGEAATALMYKALEYESGFGRDGGCKPAFRGDGCHSLEGYQPERYKLRRGDDGLILPTDLLIRDLAEMRLGRKAVPADGGEDKVRYLAHYFHRALADMIVSACVEIRTDKGVDAVCLTGGVFQNTLLLRMCDDALTALGFRVLTHSLVPPNDGGIALGQAVYAMARLK